MPDSSRSPGAPVTDFLRAWSGGDREALDAVIPLVHAELKRLARSRLAGERPNHTIQPTALVNEAYLRLRNERGMQWQDRSHFLAVAAQLMRFILVDHARKRRYQKRGGDQQIVALDMDVADLGAEGVLRDRRRAHRSREGGRAQGARRRAARVRGAVGRRVGAAARRVGGNDRPRLEICARLAAARAHTMSGDRWQRVNELFHAALEREGATRDAFLREACRGDEELYADVTSLIAADAETPAIALEHLGESMAADWAAGTERPSLVGRDVDRYQIVAHLGSGGMGDVYRATDTILGRDVALKVLAPALHADTDFRRRLEKEARAASSLNHPNIVTVYEIGQAGTIDFVASELVDGVTLRDRLAAGPLSMRDLVDIGVQVAAALATAHGSGIVHRDIKPENVMIRRDGIVKVVDFGLAKRTGPRGAGDVASAAIQLTQPGVVAGTACYMSPEQALGEAIDQRSDLFSLGILLYEMATGQRPFIGASDAAMYDALLHASPAAPTTLRDGLPVEFDLVIGRALEKDRELRYQSAADLGADLKRLQRPPATRIGRRPSPGEAAARARMANRSDRGAAAARVGPGHRTRHPSSSQRSPDDALRARAAAEHRLYAGRPRARCGDRLRLARRAAGVVCSQPARRAAPSLASLDRFRRCDPDRRHRGRHLSLLVARRPQHRVRHRRRPEAKGSRGWPVSYVGGECGCPWRRVEPRRGDLVCGGGAGHLPRVGRRRRANGCDEPGRQSR